MFSWCVSFWPEWQHCFTHENACNWPGDWAYPIVRGCLESQPTRGAFACPVYRGWVGKSELFNFKCYNKKANVVETKEMSIWGHKLEVLGQDCWTFLPLGSGVKRTLCDRVLDTILGCIPLDCLCHKCSGLTLTGKFSMFLHPVES